MLEINGSYISEDVQTIVLELKHQLELNGIKRFAKFIPTTNNLMTNCPFHKDGQERKPSFGISTKDGTCHCFGCGWVGSLSEMISNCFGYDDFGNYGNKWLVRNFVSLSVEIRPELELDINRGKSIQQKSYVSEAELDTYRYYHPYMYKRKLTNEIIDLFDIGYDKQTNCLTFPQRDIDGNTLFIARRSVATKYFNYPSDVDKPVYGLYELHHRFLSDAVPIYSYNFFPKEVIICESMLDALTCWVYGKYAVALNGTGNDLQFKQLNLMPCRHFILATDMDNAGLKARERIKKALKGKIVTEYFWDINIAKDINDMSKEYFSNLVDRF